MTKAVEEYSAKELMQIVFSRRDPEAIESLYGATRTYGPLFIKTWKEQEKVVRSAVDDLYDVIEWLREEKHYTQADRLRTITGRLARETFKQDNPELFTEVARDWPEQLSLKESKKLLKEIEELRAKVKQND